MAKTSSAPFAVQIVAAPPPLTSSLRLTSGAGGSNLPFTVGYAFPKGSIPGGTALTLNPATGTVTSQVVVKRQWNDGSIKHVIISGHIVTALAAGGAQDVTVVSGSSSGTALTSANIQAAAPTASVQCGTIGTVTLSNLLATPFRTWISGPEMVECHYHAAVGSDATLRVWFHVKLYSSGRIWIRAICENGYVTNSVTGPSIDKSYVPTVTIGGVTAFDNAGAALAHYGHTRWDAEGWIGGDPQITPQHNAAQLISTRLVPNYWQRNPTAGALNGLTLTYAQMQRGDWTQDQSNTGFQNEIGLLPLWDALYCTSADARAYRSVVANARSLNSYGIVWRDPTDNESPTRPSVRPGWTMDGNNAGGENGIQAGQWVWDVAHHGSGGFVAYLITGDYYFLETMQLQAAACYLVHSSARGSGTNRALQDQTRGMAWSLRTVGQLAAIGPSDNVTTDYAALLAGNMTILNNVRLIPGQNQLGTLYNNDLATNAYADPGVCAPWQQNFVVQTLGYLSEMDPLSDLSTLILVRDFSYKWPVGLLGASGSANYCFNFASAYNLRVAATATGDLTQCYGSWGLVFQNTYGFPNGTCSNTLQGSSGGDPLAASTGYYGNLLPAIAYAVDHGAAGADLAWARLTGASNWSSIVNCNPPNSPTFGDQPMWGVVPKSFPIIT
jgi:hypothetical protein